MSIPEWMAWWMMVLCTGLGMGIVTLIVGLVWFWAVLKCYKALQETYWIVAWMCYRRGDLATAKSALRTAIDADKIKNGED